MNNNNILNNINFGALFVFLLGKFVQSTKLFWLKPVFLDHLFGQQQSYKPHNVKVSQL